MRKLITMGCLAVLAVGMVSCGNDDDNGKKCCKKKCCKCKPRRCGSADTSMNIQFR